MRGRQLARRGSQRRRALRSIVTFLVTAINAELAERAEKTGLFCEFCGFCVERRAVWRRQFSSCRTVANIIRIQ